MNQRHVDFVSGWNCWFLLRGSTTAGGGGVQHLPAKEDKENFINCLCLAVWELLIFMNVAERQEHPAARCLFSSLTTLTTVGLVSLTGTQIIQTNISLVCTYSSDRYGELKLTKSKINKWLTKWINAIDAPKVILKQMKALIAWLYMLCIPRCAINQPIGKTLTTTHTVNDRPLICIRKQICINKYCTCGEINRENVRGK